MLERRPSIAIDRFCLRGGLAKDIFFIFVLEEAWQSNYSFVLFIFELEEASCSKSYSYLLASQCNSSFLFERKLGKAITLHFCVRLGLTYQTLFISAGGEA